MPPESLPLLKELSAVPRRDRQPASESAAALGGRVGLLAQGRHARERRAEAAAQLRARRPGARRQQPSRAHQRPGRPQQHHPEGARARLRCRQGHARSSTRCSRAIKDLEHEGYEFEAADGSLALLIRRALVAQPAPFDVDAYHVSMRSNGTALGVRSDRQGTRGHRTRPHGGRRRRTGQRARRARCAPPSSSSTRSSSGCASPTTRCGSSTRRSAPPRGPASSSSRATTMRPGRPLACNENIIEASLQALVDSLEYALLKKELRPASQS